MLKQVLTTLLLGGMVAAASADEVIFKNGDKLTGTIKSADAGKLKIATKVAGDVTVDMADVQSFTTDQPIAIKMKDNSVVNKQLKADDQVKIEEIKRINQN